MYMQLDFILNNQAHRSMKNSESRCPLLLFCPRSFFLLPNNIVKLLKVQSILVVHPVSLVASHRLSHER